MNAPLILMAVLRVVPTQLDHFSAAALMDTVLPVTGDLVWTIMSVHLEHTTASSAVSTLLEDSDVNATQAFNSTQIKQLVLVIHTASLICLHYL